MSWNPNPAARRQVLAAMKRRRRALTAKEIATFLGKSGPSVLSILYALRADGIVSLVGRTGKSLCWRTTGKPMPKSVRPVRKPSIAEVRLRYDHHALAEAMGSGVSPGAGAPVMEAWRL